MDRSSPLVGRLVAQAALSRQHGALDLAALLEEAASALRSRLDNTCAEGAPAGLHLPDKAAFLIHYDDRDKPAEIWTGEAAARARFKRISDQWNAHLFVKLQSNSADDRAFDANARIVPLSDRTACNMDDGPSFIADFFRERGCLPSLVQSFEAGQASAMPKQPPTVPDGEEWTQDGFAVVSLVTPAGPPGLPLLHSFHLPEWEALARLDALATLPEELRDRATVVPARLLFRF